MTMTRAVEMWTGISTALAGLMLAWSILKQYFPPHLRGQIETYMQRLVGYVYPYIQITFAEFSGERLKRSEIYTAIENYLMENASARAKRLKADAVKGSQSLLLTMDENEEITDMFEGVKVWWSSSMHVSRNNFSFSIYPQSEERRYFMLTMHRNHRGLITERYIRHILDEGKVIAASNQQRKLYTNNPSSNWYGYKSTKRSHVVFEHPATFETLLYGPPGTGKSTMVAAMANLLNYDIYDLELTTVKDISELRKLLIETSSKSIIVIEDIDCSLDLTGQRKKKEEKKDDDENDDPAKKLAKDEENKQSKVTLSGLLNIIDGIWSACGGERIIVFTTVSPASHTPTSRNEHVGSSKQQVGVDLIDDRIFSWEFPREWGATDHPLHIGEVKVVGMLLWRIVSGHEVEVAQNLGRLFPLPSLRSRGYISTMATRCPPNSWLANRKEGPCSNPSLDPSNNIILSYKEREVRYSSTPTNKHTEVQTKVLKTIIELQESYCMI